MSNDPADPDRQPPERRDPDRPDRRKPLRPKLRCPICLAFAISHVVNGRTNVEPTRERHLPPHYWRLRRCDACRETYTTIEIVVPVDRPPAQDVVSPSAICHPLD